ncbi:MAG: peptidoglycan recognition protein family protein [Candidatus Pacearchaeota archaeon]|nr:peptidoglycan recognition protein family protein [Candidatus Pacearchaeota archaeon]
MQKLENIKYLIIHHTNNNKNVEEIRQQHKARGFEDIGYHFLIDKKGNLIKGRNVKFVGAHTLHYNKNSLGIALIGNFNKEKPTRKQIQTLIRFLKEKIKQYDLKINSIKGHCNFNKKSCPGKNLNLKKIKQQLR